MQNSKEKAARVEAGKMEARYSDGSITIYQGDCLDVMAEMKPGSIDAVVTDPPYGLGFMAKHWDRGVPGPAFWYQALEVLKPGAHLLAFGGSRTFHRLACAIEDAGFEIRDCLCWLYGSGFPKSLDVSKAIDAAATEAAREWNGWGTALKPAFEPIILARKPLSGTVAKNVLEHGTGAINVDGCRIEGPPSKGGQTGDGLGYHGANGERTIDRSMSAGRWPANVIVDEVAAAMIDEQSGTDRGAFAPVKGTEPSAPTINVYSGGSLNRKSGAFHADSGGASRFFYCAKASRSEREAGCESVAPVTGADAVDRAEDSAGTKSPRAGAGRTAAHVRNNHPTVKPIDLMRWLVRLVTPPGGVVLDPFAGSGSTLIAAHEEGFKSIGIELEKRYCDIIAARASAATAQGRLF